MAPLPHTTLSPERQAELDHLYWHTDRTATSIAIEYAVTPHRLATMVSPLPAGVECWLCHAPLCYRNRSERAQAMKLATTKWGGRLVCPCGAQQLRGLLREGLTDTDAAILAPIYTPHRHARPQDPWARYGYYPGTPSRSAALVQAGVEALAAVGLRWCGTFVKVDDLTSPAALVEQLEQTLDTRVLVVPSLTEAMCNEGDSLALFLLLVGRGWRVISSARGVPQGGGYDGWLDEFPTSASVVAAAHAPMLRLVRGGVMYPYFIPDVRRRAGMEIAARMSSKGQLTVPKVVRDALGVSEGDSVVFRVEGNCAVLAKTPEFLDLAGSFRVPVARRNAEWDEIVRTTRVARTATS